MNYLLILAARIIRTCSVRAAGSVSTFLPYQPKTPEILFEEKDI